MATKQGDLPNEGLLRQMSDRIAHRGPDADGVWCRPGIGLAHRRLAIIDLSPAGTQPMSDALERLTVVFNGEIYNYRELQQELQARGVTFRSTSDTEVILAAYQTWGVECLTKLRGMFAFALWDAKDGRLLLARDRIGKKPLFFGRTNEGDLVFASELKALAPAVDLKPDWEAVRLFLGLQYVPSPRTGFVDVSQLLPGQYGVWEHGSWSVASYHVWDARMKDEVPDDLDARIRAKLDEAVKVRQLAADVPVGAFLSGGIDSAAVVAFASKHVSKPLQTFTMGFPQQHMDERREAREIASAFNTDHQEFEARPEYLRQLVDELVVHYDAPYADSSALPLWLLAQQTAKEIKVVLTGDGGDEVFGGYRRYGYFERALQLASVPLLPRIAAPMSLWFGNLVGDVRFGRMSRVVEATRRNPARAYGEMFCGSYFGSAALQDLCQPEFISSTASADAVQFVTERIARTQTGSPLGDAMAFDLQSYLPDDLNVKMDRATMRFGLEARSPFLDQELVALALSLPLREKVHHGKTKIALRRALQGVLPDAVLRRPKRGFQIPLAEWFRGPLRELVRERCLDPKSPLMRVVRPQAVERLIQENDRGSDRGNHLWMLLSLSTWLSRYAD